MQYYPSISGQSVSFCVCCEDFVTCISISEKLDDNWFGHVTAKDPIRFHPCDLVWWERTKHVFWSTSRDFVGVTLVLPSISCSLQCFWYLGGQMNPTASVMCIDLVCSLSSFICKWGKSFRRLTEVAGLITPHFISPPCLFFPRDPPYFVEIREFKWCF